eukprot:9232618-Pyramimonas_sp.AAC.2
MIFFFFGVPFFFAPGWCPPPRACFGAWCGHDSRTPPGPPARGTPAAAPARTAARSRAASSPRLPSCAAPRASAAAAASPRSPPSAASQREIPTVGSGGGEEGIGRGFVGHV